MDNCTKCEYCNSVYAISCIYLAYKTKLLKFLHFIPSPSFSAYRRFIQDSIIWFEQERWGLQKLQSSSTDFICWCSYTRCAMSAHHLRERKLGRSSDGKGALNYSLERFSIASSSDTLFPPTFPIWNGNGHNRYCSEIFALFGK